MSKSEKKLIYVVEPSRVLSKLITTELKDNGYEVEVFSTGLEALRTIIKTTPDCILADKVLPVIDGLELCKIIKEGSSKTSIPFIIFSAEDTVFDFWTNSTGANDVISISHANFEELSKAVEKIFAYKYIETDSFFEEEKSEKEALETSLSDEEKLMYWIVDAMDKSEFYLSMVRNIIDLYEYVKKPELLVEKLFEMFYKVCDYDVIELILDNQIAKVYESGLEFMPEEVGQEFWDICKTDFEQKAKKNHTITYDTISLMNIVKSEYQKSKFESYRDFTIKAGDEFIGTLHLASCKKKIFNYKVQSSIEFIIPALGYLLQESLYHETISRSEKMLRSAFSKFVPEEIINDMLKSDDAQEQVNNNEKRNVVVLMCDIRNFTSISEINQPEDVVGFLNTYFTHMVDIVKKYGGTVDKFIGDAIMVLFGAPISYNDNAQRAVQAAIEMYGQLDQIPCSQLKFPEGVKLDIGIGIHYGDVIVGNIGSIDKTSYTVIGDTVNLASRLEGLTKLYGAKVIISEAVCKELSENMNVLLLDSVKVKGKKESVQIYRADEKALPSDFTEAYSKGFKSYSEGAFALAKPYFEKASEILPNDKATKLLLGRCNEFIVNKPENWDGAITLTSK
ncbi:MAG: response regulator [Treponema sp.]|nr:response regulator [Treponema sp.]